MVLPQEWPPISSFQPSTFVKAHRSPCKYIISHQSLGSGSFSEVHECKHIDTHAHYAVKVIKKLDSKVKLIQNEFKVLSRISQSKSANNEGQKSLLRLRDYFETDDNLYLVTDLAVGGDLFDKLVNEGSYDKESDGLRIVNSLVCGLLFLKQNNIIHRDIKAENILFKYSSTRFEILIGDFGLSTFAKDEDHIHQASDLSNILCGTLSYMAPEILARQQYSFPIDIWALGVLMYFMFCGYMPFDCETDDETKQAIATGDYTFDPPEYWDHVSHDTRDIISSCFVVDQSDRVTLEALSSNPWLKNLGKRIGTTIAEDTESSIDDRLSPSSIMDHHHRLPSSMETSPNEEDDDEEEDDDDDEERQLALDRLRESLRGSLKPTTTITTDSKPHKPIFTLMDNDDDSYASPTIRRPDIVTTNFSPAALDGLMKKSFSYTSLRDAHRYKSSSTTSLKELLNLNNANHPMKSASTMAPVRMNGAVSVEPAVSKSFRLASSYSKSRINSTFNSINPSRINSRNHSSSHSRVQSTTHSRSASRGASRRHSREHSRTHSALQMPFS
ncbi:protein kinase [Saccharomycopsis crataegensis]|uniref:Protein kinase n=1 Tax=Saccharomycopsis crataegensis TaxID=43959 RepID=A0AAV5QEJ4_9ASCO|nr:protein kinase [Saccharomycopsis crataegensis]